MANNAQKQQQSGNCVTYKRKNVFVKKSEPLSAVSNQKKLFKTAFFPTSFVFVASQLPTAVLEVYWVIRASLNCTAFLPWRITQ